MYYGVGGRSEIEWVEKKSRFLGYAFPVTSEEEAREGLSKIRKAHPFATHVCFAFVADKAGNLMRYGDDGEPQGTAGVPMLEVLKAKNLKETCVAVVRYFGGIKLGAGGLCRAYSKTASLAIEANTVVETAEAAFLRAVFPYELSDAFRKFAEKEGLAPAYAYDAEVTATFPVKREEEARIAAALVDFLAGRCRVSTDGYGDYRF